MSFGSRRLNHHCGQHLSGRDRPGVRRCIRLALALSFIHAHCSHRDGAASASAQSQRGTRALPRRTPHGRDFAAHIVHVRVDGDAGFRFQDEDLPAERG